MGLLSGLKKKAQKSAKEAYKAKVADEQKRKKKKASAASREEVKKRQSEKPKEKPKKKASYFETQAKQQRAVANVQKNKKSWAQMAQEANEKRKAENRNALGTTAKTRQIQSNNQLSNSLTKAIYETGTRVKDASALASGSIANTQKGIADYEKKTGYKFSDEQKKQITQDALKEDVKLLRDKDYNKAVKRAAQDYADKKTGKKWKVKSEDMNAEEYQKMQNAIRMGGGNADTANKAVGDKLAKKIGSRTAYAADRNGISRFSHGALQGLAPVDVEKGIGIYGEDEKQALKESKESKAGMAGYMAGFAGSMALGGTSGMGKAIAKGVGKGAAKATTKSTAKKFMQNRAGELAAETPLNVADAAKMSMDENGKVDKKQMLKYLGLNTVLTGGMGGAMEGVGMKLAKKNADDYIKLLRKEAKEGLSPDEQAKKLKLKEKLDKFRKDTQSAKSNYAESGYTEGQGLQRDIRTQRKLAQNKAQGKTERARQQWRDSGDRLEMKAGRESLAEGKARTAELTSQKEALEQQAENISARIDNAKTPRTKKQARAQAGRQRSLNTIETKIGAINRELDVSPEVTKLERKLRDEQVYHLPGAVKKYGADSKQVKAIREGIAKLKSDLDDARALDEQRKTAPAETPRGEAPAETPRSDAPVEAPRSDAPVEAQRGETPVRGETTDIDARIAELEAQREAARKEAQGHVAHKRNALKAQKEGRRPKDQGHLDELQKQIDEADAKRDAIDQEISALKKQKNPERYSSTEVTGEPEGIKNLDNDKDTPDIFREPTTEAKGTHTPDGAPSRGEPASPGKAKEVKPREDWSKYEKRMDGKPATVIRRWFSSLYGIEQAAMKAGDKELLNQTTHVYLAKNKVSSWIEHSRAGFDREVKGKSLNAVFDDAGLFGKNNAARRADFTNYLTYKHAIDRLNEGKPVHMAEDGKSLYSKQDYEDMISAITRDMSDDKLKALDSFEKDVRDYFDDLMQYRVDSGLVSKEFADTMKNKYPHYVPTFREGDDWLKGVETDGESYAASIKQSIGVATGGNAPLEDLYQAMAKTTMETIQSAEENAMMNLYARARGFSPDAIPKGTTMDDLATAAISSTGDNKSGWRMTFFVDGERVTMPVNKQIALGLRELHGEQEGVLLNAIGKMSTSASPLARQYKGLITDWNVFFGVRNGMRDFQQALVNSKDTKKFFFSIPSAVHAIANPDSAFMKLYEANGGRYSQLVRQRKLEGQASGKIVEPGSGSAAKKAAKKTADLTIGKLEAINGAIEMGPRMSEFIGTLNKAAEKNLGKSVKKIRKELMEEMFPGRTAKQLNSKELEELENAYANKIVSSVGKEAVDEAMRNSAEITLNFSRHGVGGQMLNAGLVPYLNPSLQGLSRTVRLFTEGKADKALLNIAMKLGTITIAPAVFNEVMLKDNEAYQSLNTRDKDTNFFISLGDGKFIKVPKPRENAVLAEPVEYGLRFFFDKARIGTIEKGEYSGWKDLGQMFKSGIDNIGPVNPLTDNIVSPVVHVMKNKTWFGGSIESTRDVLDLADGSKKYSEISDQTTSLVAIELANKKIGGKKISDIVRLSPKKIDNLMDSYLGVIYDFGISQTADSNNGNPVINQFIKDSVFSNKNGTELWAEFEKANAPKTLSGKAEQKAKELVFGHNKGAIRDKSIEAKDWLNQKGYDDMTYSTAMEKMLYDDSLTKKQKDDLRKKVKIMQNGLRRDLVYGSKEVTPDKDPIRKLSGLVGLDKAMKDYTYTDVDEETGEKKNQHLDAYLAYKKSKEFKGDPKKNGQRFLNLYCDMRYTNGKIGESKSYPQWMTAAVICASSKGNNDALAASYITPDASYDQYGNVKAGKSAKEKQAAIIERGKNYVKYTGTKGYYIDSQKTLFKGARDFGYEYTSKMHDYDKTMTLAESKKKYSDLAYYAADTGGYVTQRMNPGRCLVKNGHGKKEIHAFAKKYDLDVESKSGWTGDDWKAFKKKVSDAVRKEYGDQPREIQAAAYHVIVGDDFGNRPFGEIGDYTQKNDTGIAALDHQDGWGGRRGRRRHGHRRHGRGGGGGGGTNEDWYKFVGDMFSAQTTKTAKVKDNTNDSLLNEAYRRRIRKKQMINQKKS